MATWNVKTDDGRGWTIIAPEGVTEAEVNAFAAESADSWVTGATYRMEADDGTPAPQPTSTPAPNEVARTAPRIENTDGSFSTERSITVEVAELNGGQPTNIPTIINGRQLAEGAAIRHAVDAVRRGAQYPSFNTIDEAVTAAQARSDAIGRASNGPTKDDYDAAVARLTARMQEIDAERQNLAYGTFRGGAAPADVPVGQRIEELDRQYDELAEQRSQLEIGSTGQTVGGMGGALAGGAAGAAMGAPLGPVVAGVGGVIGSILGGAAGTAAGTHLWDIPEARETREVTDQEAADLIKGRTIESLIYDGAFVLLLGPGGRVLGKMTKGAKFLPALKAAVGESIGWKEISQIRNKQSLDLIQKRAQKAPSGLSTQVSRALDLPTAQTDIEATEQMLVDLSQRSGGQVPSPGQVSGFVEGVEAFARRQAPKPFFKNAKLLEDAALDIRRSALSSLDAAGARTGPELGEAVRAVAESADRTLKRVTAPVFEKARQQLVTGDMTPVINVIDGAIARVERSANRVGGITPGEVGQLRSMRDMLTASGTNQMPIDGLQDFISGNKAAARAIAPDGSRPSEFFNKVLGDLIGTSDAAYLRALRGVKDKTLVQDLLQARELYRDTMSDLYADAMAKLATKRPEAYGAALTGKGHVTEIRELRAAMARAAENAPRKARVAMGDKGQQLREQSRAMLAQERKRIDAGMVKGFIEKHTQSLESLDTKLKDPDFRLTLKELLVGEGAADPKLGQRVLEDLNRAMAVVQLAAPRTAPEAGRLGVPEMGRVGAGTTTAALTGTNIHGAVPIVYSVFGIARTMGIAAANYLTTGNAGMLHAIERAFSLARIAGKNAAAAEAARAAFNDLKAMSEAPGVDAEGAAQAQPARQIGTMGIRG